METLECIVESIVYKSDETGYTVCKVRSGRENFTAVGVIPYIKEEQNLQIKGEWIIHKQFGKQFSIEEYKEILPSTIEGIEKYLGSGIIHGIGPVTAKKIIKHFGEDSLKVLDEDIERLKEVEGIGEKKYQIICDSYVEQRELKDILLYGQGHGLTTNQCIKIYKIFGVNSESVINENPYKLCEEISGIGFMTADRIAKTIGIEQTSDFRIQSGIMHVLNNFSTSGNTYMPKERLMEETSKVLDVSKELVEENIYNCLLSKKIEVQVINGEEAVFLIPYFYCELGITNKIITLAMHQTKNINIDIDFEIELFQQKSNINLAPSQKEAIEGAFENGIEIITGGPGTGKTTIIKAIIEIYEKCNMKVLLAAPTGRAAKRMSESTGRQAKTIHRLLEMGVSDKEENSIFARGESSPLEGDVVIIDEVSMIDVMLMHNLLKAIKLGTRLIIVGDVDQLPSVGPGNVLNDLIESKCIKVVRLKEIFRQGKESMIVTNAHRINKGELPYLNKKEGDFFFDKRETVEDTLKTIIDLINRRLPKFNGGWDILRDIQILTPTRKGELGVSNLNSKLQESLNGKSKYKKEKEVKDIVFRVGDKVMQTKNNYSLKWYRIKGEGDNEGVGVFNGDMGFIESIDDEQKTVTVVFDEERKVVYDYIYLEELELAYAITIHKSQGSEFKVVIIPVFMGSSFLMNRNLLYTAITRAKELVVIVGTEKALKYMVVNTNSMQRYSSLRDKIMQVTTSEIIES